MARHPPSTRNHPRPMKTALITTAIAAAALVGTATEAEAGRFGFSISTGSCGSYGGYSHSYRPSYGPSYRSYGYRGNHCTPRYVVRTCEVNRCRHRRVRYDHCGRAHSYYVTVVTYRTYYSDGTCNTFTRTYG